MPPELRTWPPKVKRELNAHGERHKVTRPIKGRFIELVMRAKAFSNRSTTATRKKEEEEEKAIEMTASTLTINLAAASAPPFLINDVQTHV